MTSYFLGGGNSNIFGIFTLKIGEDEPNLTIAYFSDGLVQKNHQLAICRAEKNCNKQILTPAENRCWTQKEPWESENLKQPTWLFGMIHGSHKGFPTYHDSNVWSFETDLLGLEKRVVC